MNYGKKVFRKYNSEQGPINLNPDQKISSLSGFIIIRFSAHVFIESDDLRDYAKERLPYLTALLDRNPEIVARRLVRSVEHEKLRVMERQAASSEYPPLHSLTSYWRLDCRKVKTSLKELLTELQQLTEVDLAYLEKTVTDCTSLSFVADQDYLEANPIGINAEWARSQPNGDGAGVGFVDLEQGWILDHEELIVRTPTVIFNDNRHGINGFVGNHGTSVLAEVVADANIMGVVGAAPGVTSVRLTSHFEASTNTEGHVADAILAAITVMSPGDVLLLEVQRVLLPTETDAGDFDAIRLASARGIIVVEAAGNGIEDLDLFTDAAGLRRLDRADCDFRDSGAILVGSCQSLLPHNRFVGRGVGDGSNFGSRVDCFAWGENITTAGWGDLDGTSDTTNYTAQFGGTSGASPIIAGAALILQGMYQQTPPPGGRLSPSQMRALLSDPATGTPQGTGVAGNIGVMPNLRSIIETTLGLSPDVYLRDDIGDTGAVPSAGFLSSSPDIIVRPTRVANPTASFGEGSGTENSNSLGFEVEAGQDNYVYLRMRNRSSSAAANNTTATVYWSEVSTLVTPDRWHRIGKTASVNVPAGDTLVVTDPIIWRAADIPATGHYCFIAILNQARDLAPVVPPPTDWDGFTAFIRNQNNVTWRNFNVIDDVADPSVHTFLLAGAADLSRYFDLEIIQRLPEQARAVLEVPLTLFAGLPRNSFLKAEVDRERQVANLILPRLRCVTLSNVKLKKGAQYPCRLILKGMNGKNTGGNSVAIRQIFEEQEVGRVTWFFQQRRKEYEE